jgi:hypothetical protein
LKKATHPLLAYNERLGRELLYLGVGNSAVTVFKGPTLPFSVDTII